MNALTLTPPEVQQGRRALDAYYTTPSLARFLIGLLLSDSFVEPGCTVLEPSVGLGSFALAAAEVLTPSLLEIVDLNPESVSWTSAALDARSPAMVRATCVGDFLALDAAHHAFDLIGGNPPFSQAEAHVRKALQLRTRGGCVAMLLRTAFLSSQERMPFWKEHRASKVYTLSERPSFTGSGTDKYDYSFFCWQRGHRGATELDVVSWR